jgi:hypothetical protein
MSFIATFGMPQVGILPLQHQAYDAGGWDLAMRASIHCVRVTGREDTNDGMGHYSYDPDSQGDLIGGNCWNANYNERPMSAWSWVWPAILANGGGGRGQRSTQTAETTANTPRIQGISTNMVGFQAIPIGKGGAPDVKRFKPKGVIIPAAFGAAGADPNGPKPDAEPADPNNLILGIGGQVVPITGGNFPNFSGVRTDFTGASFPEFEGVRTNFSLGNAGGGATFSGVKTNFSLGSSGGKPK